jgi:peroxiredoxin
MKDKFQLIGTKIQEFSLPNTKGETINIRSFEGEKNVIVILFRSIN